MASKVFYTKDKLNGAKLFDALDIKFLKPGTITAIKIHFGEMGNTAYLKPDTVRAVIEKVIATKANAFLTDANTLYKGTRSDAVNHTKTAHEHGYNIENIGIPVVIADGVTGKDYIKVPVTLKHFKEVNIASAAVHAENIVVLTHFKGHELSGFGGTIKNIGMGFGSRSGKQLMHAEVKPIVAPDKCTSCGTCIKWCPTNAISFIDKKAFINSSKCIGCAECIASCDYSAIAVSWSGSGDSVQEKMVEYFYGIWKEKKDKMVYFNYVIDISPECDCYGWNEPPIAEDVGLMASYDPVALDQASADMIIKNSKKDVFKTVHPTIDWGTQLRYAEDVGIGSRKYELITI